MKLTEGQVWAHRNKEDNQYDKYLVIDYVTNTCFNGRETPFGKVTSFICCNYNYLLNECWELLDAEKICELLRKQSECIRIIHESAEYERQLISAREFAEQEVKEKESICESVQARLTQVANELDVERKKRAHVEKQNLEFEEKLKDSISCGADKQDRMLVLLQDGSTHFVKNGTDILFDRDNNVICVLNEKADTLAIFDKDFVRGAMLTTIQDDDN
ncbi:hypothetical protein [Butyricicoccus intestinisimiae]|uniref:Uncharacterized protein n=1 Tax=Butyricicoccus intestinisimiae TaxID=2841509 RepID=A0ABS6EUI4_9FIRM|nr:hypothetical protein [Butyricicoccus intestinisimiae]MBU5491325.1 hypothetical protein [Butyricicoccus intestinisimiae]